MAEIRLIPRYDGKVPASVLLQFLSECHIQNYQCMQLLSVLVLKCIHAVVKDILIFCYVCI